MLNGLGYSVNAMQKNIRLKYDRDGFIRVLSLADAPTLLQLNEVSRVELEKIQAPIEFEVDVGYPGAPTSRESDGGGTPRRLLHTFDRSSVYREWATNKNVYGILRQLMHTDRILLSLCHHNCVMTKHPVYSSQTYWHQDIRYWSFDRDELTTVWLALGEEETRNGSLKVIPGSHLMNLPNSRFDDDRFLLTDTVENKQLLASAIAITLSAGDALFFHSRLLHAAGPNLSDEVKIALVFTYHASDNSPTRGTRSALIPSIPLGY